MNLPYYYLIPIAILSLYFLFKKKKPAITPLTDIDRKILNEYVLFYKRLSATEQLRFENQVSKFLSSIRIEGVEVEITTLDEILIASSAVIPIFGFDNWEYKNLSTVLLYPDTFNTSFQFEEAKDRNVLGMVGTGYMNGQMILSKNALRAGFLSHKDQENTGIHEFVHLLDKSDGAIDGIPENLLAHQYTLPWIKMMHDETRSILKNKSDISAYAITNQAEFLAVVSEYFFEKPDQLKDKHPALYGLLSKMYAQNLAQ